MYSTFVCMGQQDLETHQSSGILKRPLNGQVNLQWPLEDTRIMPVTFRTHWGPGNCRYVHTMGKGHI